MRPAAGRIVFSHPLVRPSSFAVVVGSFCIHSLVNMVAITAVLAVSAAFELAAAVPAPTRYGKQGPKGHKYGKHHGGPTNGSGILVQLGPRPYYLVDNMEDSPLKEKLDSCKNEPKYTTPYTISHRGAPLEFPEHSRSGYDAAAREGAGKMEQACEIIVSILLTHTQAPSSVTFRSPQTESLSAATQTAISTIRPTS